MPADCPLSIVPSEQPKRNGGVFVEVGGGKVESVGRDGDIGCNGD